MQISKQKRPVAIVVVSYLMVIVAIVITVVALNVHIIDAAPTSDPVTGKRGRGYNADEYMAARRALLSKERKRALGAGLPLNENELKLNKILLKEKNDIMERSRLDKLAYTPALSFFKSKEWMGNTTTFKIIRKMPKGAALHVHSPAMASIDWLVRNLTYRENVYMCEDKDGIIMLNASLEHPNGTECLWKLVKEERAASSSSQEFDETLRKGLSFLTRDPLTAYSDKFKAWARFEKYFDQVRGLLENVPYMKDFFQQALHEFHEDNVQYIEWRGGLVGYKELDGRAHDAEYAVAMFKNISKDFVLKHPDFMGTKVIMSGLRFTPKKQIEDQIKEAMEIRRKFPDFFVGYDLVAQEDIYKPLLFYLDALLYPTRQSLDDALPYFFHAGETNWDGTDVDENLLDALLLNTSRIGHGYALAKHPELADLVKSRGVAVEVNPISNQLLGLVSDLRNHALVPLLEDDFPLVVSSDDPANWEALPLTHDFFLAFMDLSGQDMGIGFLKQLAINSLKYSSLSDSEKDAAFALWESKWDKFVTEAVHEFS